VALLGEESAMLEFCSQEWKVLHLEKMHKTDSAKWTTLIDFEHYSGFVIQLAIWKHAYGTPFSHGFNHGAIRSGLLHFCVFECAHFRLGDVTIIIILARRYCRIRLSIFLDLL
jgi:hypothetical protein